ncbi:cyclopropane-fatty-acyl-phospholipid synthase family protein [Bdellovibrio sp. ZAP7]|uniref:SAM-dependent methyltransferase n=1 Tax=Bdellovibrio sp. ZAP7 TaxID=2231053 RepID=UPI001AEFB5E2|nr:cyclopropane-fatty-acyl-phospholipid synthase family protein [Bdellovibrio sp. ZAP7]
MALEVLIDWMEKGWIPEKLVRVGIRQLCRDRLKSLDVADRELEQERNSAYVTGLKKSAIAFATEKANQQHYELPASFYHLVLGKNKKYSSGYWPQDCSSLDEAEEAALRVTIERAQVADGMRILDLGCGWGSVSLKLAEKFPNSQIVGLSNSKSQREYILEQASKRGLSNVNIVTGDIGDFDAPEDWNNGFDRVISVEMLEHVRNYEALFERLSTWLKPQGKLFVHIFTHSRYSYPFETEGADNWMGKYFFTGGQMPSHQLLTYFQKDLLLEQQWSWNGVHYQKTSEAWLQNMDRHRDEILNIFAKVYGNSESEVWFERWRVFFMSCAELFGFDKGREWGVSHYLFKNRPR